MTNIQALQLSESQKDCSWFLPEHFSLEEYSFEITPDDDAMVGLKSKRDEYLSRVRVLRTSFTSWEPESMHAFLQTVFSFQAELQSLNLDPTSIVFRESQALDASVASLIPLFQQEAQAIEHFQNERYGKHIQMVSNKLGDIMRDLEKKKYEHASRIHTLQMLHKEYEEIVANADDIFVTYQSHIKTVNASIEDIQACISRCFDNPQSISFTDRIKHGFGEFGSGWRSKNFRGSIEDQRKTLQAKVDDQLKQQELFYVNTSIGRSEDVCRLKTEATNLICDTKKILEDYLHALSQPLEAPLKANQQFTVWLQDRFSPLFILLFFEPDLFCKRIKSLVDCHDSSMIEKFDAACKFVVDDPAFSESRWVLTSR
jgi:hypothetical protein